MGKRKAKRPLMKKKKPRKPPLIAELKDARWIAAALLYQMGGEATIDPNVFDDPDTRYFVRKIQQPDGLLRLSLQVHAAPRIVDGQERKGKHGPNNTQLNPGVAPSA